MFSPESVRISSLLPNWAYVLLMVAVLSLVAFGILRNNRWLARHRRSLRRYNGLLGLF